MSTDYPLMTLPSYELYQLAHIATFLAEALARHRRAGHRSDRAAAVRDIAGGRTAYENALGVTTPSGQLPGPIDMATYESASEMVERGPREAHVVSLEATGRSGWAVAGRVPGIGRVGAVVPDEATANALRQHLLTQPVGELAPWAVRDRPVRMPKLPRRVDLAAFVENLDPRRLSSRAVVRHLRGLDRRTDAAIRGRFAGVDLDAPLVVAPSTPQSASPTTQPTDTPAGVSTSPAAADPAPRAGSSRPPVSREGRSAGQKKPSRPVVASRHVCGLGAQVTSGAAKAPTTSAGP
ncbi:hypothetical protein [Pseudonocardia sp. MH-G8]|uniref:hypothetical protein n=1 Tax=Pseudonocardia sp. MH-G8 TaxID=1854588 RepID=UPI000BA0AD28|nr:hypothetical protein [Pseudonocardia sp. MH-G8]OZM80002.1 hypothetical protein CFP66_23715 [Pseudonocardia sp. MH-G8]